MPRFIPYLLLIAAALAAPGHAQSPPSPEVGAATTRFLALATDSSNFIDEAGRTAIANGASAPLQHFAHDAIVEQDRAQKRLAPWASLLQPHIAGPITYDRPMFEYGPIGLAFVPLNAAVIAGSFIWNNAVGVTTGGLLVSSDHKQQLEAMQAMMGDDFNRAYLESQRSAYRALWTVYDEYGRTGDDEALKRVARDELPVLSALLKSLDRL